MVLTENDGATGAKGDTGINGIDGAKRCYWQKEILE
jgi:hypothetical protein